MKLFSVGPVQMYPETMKIMGSQEPYFRTQEFSEVMLDVEHNFLASLNAPQGSKFALLTSSGTGGLQAAVTNLLDAGDEALVICAGGFGKRFAQICEHFHIHTSILSLESFEGDLSLEQLEQACRKKTKALFVQGCETSTARRFDLATIGQFCREHCLYFVVDAVSAYLSDAIDMQAMHIDVLTTASQKALALPAGLSLLAFSPAAVKCIEDEKNCAPFYMNMKEYLANQKRGQTPYTPAVLNAIALQQRLQSITKVGITAINEEHVQRATYFRAQLKRLDFEMPAIPLSNCCTPLIFKGGGAQKLYNTLRYEHDITLCPSGGDLADNLLRVGHMGNLCTDDYDALLQAMEESL